MPTAGDTGFLFPDSIDAALALIADDEAHLVGGGTSMGVLMRTGLMEVETLVSLSRVPGLDVIRFVPGEPDHLEIGSMVTLDQLASNAIVREHLPALAEAASQVGNPRVRSVATMGGGIAHADPRQDLPPVLLVLDATVDLVGQDGPRSLPIAEVFLGFMDTAVGEDEIVTTVRIPVPAGSRMAYYRFTPASHDDYPTVCVAARLLVDGDTVTDARVAVGGAGPAAYLVAAAEGLAGVSVTDPASLDARIDDVAAAAMEQARPSDDQRGSAAYKRKVTGVVTRRAVRRALG